MVKCDEKIKVTLFAKIHFTKFRNIFVLYLYFRLELSVWTPDFLQAHSWFTTPGGFWRNLVKFKRWNSCNSANLILCFTFSKSTPLVNKQRLLYFCLLLIILWFVTHYTVVCYSLYCGLLLIILWFVTHYTVACYSLYCGLLLIISDGPRYY